MKTRIIARLDIKKNRLIKGVHLEGLRPLGDPCTYAQTYYQEGVDEILLLDSVATLHGRNALGDVITNITNDVFIPITVGGGISSVHQAKELLNSGADKITLNTSAIENPKLITDLANELGSQAVVVSLQVQRINNSWRLMTHYGREVNNRDFIEWIQEIQDRGAGEIMITSIDRDGTNMGYDLELVKKTKPIINVPLICSGGLANVEQISECIVEGASGVALASALHYKKLTLEKLKSGLIKNNIEVRK